MYQNYETTNELGLRWYHTPAGALPSITTVLGGSESAEKTASLEAWRESFGRAEAEIYTQKACDHGTMVHLLAERFLKGEDVAAPVDGLPIPERDMGAFNGLKMKLKRINVVQAQEQSVYSPLLGVAGRFDCVGEYDGTPSIIDFKTAARIKGSADIHDYYLQLCFYAQAHNELFGSSIEQGVVLMAAGGGMPLEFKMHLPPYIDELKERIAEFWRRTLARPELNNE